MDSMTCKRAQPQLSSVVSDKLVAFAVLVAHVAGETEVKVVALAALPSGPHQWTGTTAITCHRLTEHS